MREFFRRLYCFLHRGRLERELDEEMQHHLTLKAGQSGETETARRQFGNVSLLKEDSRAIWSWRFVDQFAQDLRYALRAMRASPLFTAMAVLSLALGIGANTAIYSFLDAVLLRSLPVSRPQELVVFEWRAKAPPKVIHGHAGTRNRDKTGIVSPNYPFPAYEFLRSDASVLSSLFAYATAWRVNLVAQKHAEVGNGQLVSGSFFRSLGVSPALGRLIDNQDDRAGAEKVAVLSYLYWQGRYASDPVRHWPIGSCQRRAIHNRRRIRAGVFWREPRNAA
jgi:macrolide transport system ATP-binding/permease protein